MLVFKQYIFPSEQFVFFFKFFYLIKQVVKRDIWNPSFKFLSDCLNSLLRMISLLNGLSFWVPNLMIEVNHDKYHAGTINSFSSRLQTISHKPIESFLIIRILELHELPSFIICLICTSFKTYNHNLVLVSRNSIFVKIINLWLVWVLKKWFLITQSNVIKKHWK